MVLHSNLRRAASRLRGSARPDPVADPYAYAHTDRYVADYDTDEPEFEGVTIVQADYAQAAPAEPAEPVAPPVELTEKRWTRGNHDRIYFKTPEGKDVGWVDLNTGREMLDDPTRKSLFDAAVNAKAVDYPAIRPELGLCAVAPVLDEEDDDDLAYDDEPVPYEPEPIVAPLLAYDDDDDDDDVDETAAPAYADAYPYDEYDPAPASPIAYADDAYDVDERHPVAMAVTYEDVFTYSPEIYAADDATDDDEDDEPDRPVFQPVAELFTFGSHAQPTQLPPPAPLAPLAIPRPVPTPEPLAKPVRAAKPAPIPQPAVPLTLQQYGAIAPPARPALDIVPKQRWGSGSGAALARTKPADLSPADEAPHDDNVRAKLSRRFGAHR